MNCDISNFEVLASLYIFHASDLGFGAGFFGILDSDIFTIAR